MEVEEEGTDYMDVDPIVLGATYHCGSHNRVKELGMGGSHPPYGGLYEENQDRQVSHFHQEDQDRRASHSYQEHCFRSYLVYFC